MNLFKTLQRQCKDLFLGRDTLRLSGENIPFWNRLSPIHDLLVDSLTRDYNAIIQQITETCQDFRRVLDVGSGTGRLAIELSHYCEMVDGIDRSSRMIDRAWKKAIRQRIQNLAFATQSAYQLEFESNLFDGIVCLNVLNYLATPQAALQEIYRVLKPGGTLIAPTYCYDQKCLTQLGSRVANLTGFKIYNRFNRHTLLKLIQGSRFQILEDEMIADVIPLAYIKALKGQ